MKTRCEHRRRRTLAPLAVLAAAGALALGACENPTRPADASTAALSASRAQEAATYRITVHNVAGALQPLTPSVVALHNPAVRIFQPGTAASAELERVAESGDVDPLATALSASRQVFDSGVAPGPGGPILPDQSAILTLQGPPGVRISLVSMLVCTNDGFTGIDSARLPKRVGASASFEVQAYDAGTERNTEARGDLVPPCVMATTGTSGGTGADQPNIAEDEVIRHHPGIDDDTDGDDILTVGQHQWDDVVARVEVERIE